MAKKTTSTTNVTTEEVVLEEVTEALNIEGVTPEETPIEQAKPEPIKRRTVIARNAAPFRKMPILETKYIVGHMTPGVAYEIVQEIDSGAFGKFYKLSNGYFITKNGNYVIN